MVLGNGDKVAHVITIDQHQYIWKILARFGLHNTRPISTPMAANVKLPKLEAPTVDQREYQSMLGSLMYAAVGTRPDIMYTVHYLSAFHRPRTGTFERHEEGLPLPKQNIRTRTLVSQETP